MNSGEQTELLAVQYLLRHGLKLVAKNYRSRFGEIDLIMQDGATLVFVEVRLRTGSSFGGAAVSIDAGKQRRIISTAEQYLASLAHIPPCRFDAMLLDGKQIQWIKNAFEA